IAGEIVRRLERRDRGRIVAREVELTPAQEVATGRRLVGPRRGHGILGDLGRGRPRRRRDAVRGHQRSAEHQGDGDVSHAGHDTVSAVARLRAHERLSFVLSSLVTACTVALPDPRPCVANEDCRDEFGGGSRCLPSGYCAAATLPPRCTRSYPEDLVDDPSRYQERTILATLYSFTDHLDSLRASELAVRLVDARTDARADAEEPRFAMLHCDTTPFAGDALGDLDAIEQLAPFLVRELGVPVLVGARGSARTEAAFRALDTGEAVIVSPSATSPQLTLLEPFVPTDDAPGFLWRTVPPDSLQSAVMAADVLGRGRTRAAI